VHKLLGTLAPAVLSMAVLVGCGGDGGSSPGGSGGYCQALSSVRDPIQALLDNHISQDGFVTLVTALHGLSDEAPRTVRADWRTFVTAVDIFRAALTRAGLTMDDMGQMGTGRMPGGMDMRQAMDAARALGSADVSTAQSAIAANARRVCHLDLDS
jgi:hypothetical protein